MCAVCPMSVEFLTIHGTQAIQLVLIPWPTEQLIAKNLYRIGLAHILSTSSVILRMYAFNPYGLYDHYNAMPTPVPVTILSNWTCHHYRNRSLSNTSWQTHVLNTKSIAYPGSAFIYFYRVPHEETSLLDLMILNTQGCTFHDVAESGRNP